MYPPTRAKVELVTYEDSILALIPFRSSLRTSSPASFVAWLVALYCRHQKARCGEAPTSTEFRPQ